jgi:hypothetical protein
LETINDSEQSVTEQDEDIFSNPRRESIEPPMSPDMDRNDGLRQRVSEGDDGGGALTCTHSEGAQDSSSLKDLSFSEGGAAAAAAGSVCDSDSSNMKEGVRSGMRRHHAPKFLEDSVINKVAVVACPKVIDPDNPTLKEAIIGR